MARRSRFVVLGLMLAVLALIAPVSAKADPVLILCSQLIAGEPDEALVFATPCIAAFGDGFVVVQVASEVEQVGGDSFRLYLLILGDGAGPAGCTVVSLTRNGEEQGPPELVTGLCLP